ncbi:hypothetical protein [Raoultella terrigena]|uniref:hypothetical protein n=1 Tax=Raoultella terrigena TaxID=577 RepID=UPI003BF59750
MLKEGTIDNFSRYAHPNASYSVFDFWDGKCIAVRWGMPHIDFYSNARTLNFM